MMPDTARKLALALDGIEADLHRLQSRVYSVRLELEKIVGRPVGLDYSKQTPAEAGR